MDIWAEIYLQTGIYRMNPQTALNTEQFNHYAITHNSTKIEGSTLTQSEAESLLETGRSVPGKEMLHQNMVLDHYEALLFIMEQAKKKNILDLTMLKQLASLVMRRTGTLINSIAGTSDVSKGDFRKVNVRAGDHYFVDASKVESMTMAFLNNFRDNLNSLNSEEEILKFSFVAHFDLVSIHPFSDGNGRTSRLLMNYVQAYHNLPLTIVHAEDRSAYIQALKDSHSNKTTEAIIDFLAAQHLKGIKTQNESYKKGVNLDIKTSKTVDKSKGYSLLF